MKKKVLALSLVLVMAIGLLAACGGSDAPAATPPAGTPAAPPTQANPGTPPAAPPPQANPGSTTDADGGLADVRIGEPGTWNPEFDYYSNPRLSVTYMVQQAGGLHQQWENAFYHWAELSNVEFHGMVDFGGDADQFMMTLPILAEQNDGLILDPDQQAYHRISEILEASGTPWMGGMAVPQDTTRPGFPLIHPYAGFYQPIVGHFFGEHLITQAQALWPNVPLSEYAWMTVDHSTIFALHQRALGAQEWFEENHPDFITEGRFFVADTSIRHWDVDTSYDVVSTILAMNPQFERWLIFGLVDAQSVGAALALDAAGLSDTSYTAPFGAEASRLMWDAGQSSALRSAGSSSTLIFAEPVYFALYSFMTGEATYTDIWPEWVNCRAGETYPMRLVPFFWVTPENYQQVFAWGDVYAGSNIFPQYSRDGITRDMFSARVQVPDWYRCNRQGCQYCAAAAALAD